jgi:long-subunit fatty acid transport protein
MQKCIRRLFILSVLMVVGAASVHAGGLRLYEEAIPDTGVGGAGRQAAGFDASTASGNPAAMTQLDRSRMEGGFPGLCVDSKFDVKNATCGDNGGGPAGYLTPAGSLYYVHSVSPDLKLGLGVGSYSNTVTADLGYKDTYHAGMGVYYRVAQPWLLMAGFGYVTSPTSSSSERGPVLPLGATFRYAAGVQYDWS